VPKCDTDIVGLAFEAKCYELLNIEIFVSKTEISFTYKPDGLALKRQEGNCESQDWNFYA